jgi:hypothetical protein
MCVCIYVCMYIRVCEFMFVYLYVLCDCMYACKHNISHGKIHFSKYDETASVHLCMYACEMRCHACMADKYEESCTHSYCVCLHACFLFLMDVPASVCMLSGKISWQAMYA